MSAPAPQYVYRAAVERVVDGDTVDVVVDVGFTTTRLERLRLRGVNTPERGEPGWAEATAFLRDLLPAGSPCVVRTYKARPETLGRYVADVWTAPGDPVAAAIIAHGHGRPL